MVQKHFGKTIDDSMPEAVSPYFSVQIIINLLLVILITLISQIAKAQRKTLETFKALALTPHFL